MSKATAISSTRDTSDWISPILVKELRQGLRSRAYFLLFLTLQLVMMLFVILSMGEGSREASGLFWMSIGTTIGFIIPAMALGAISSEVNENRLDMLVLTHMSARRIILGKWIALVVQGLLLISAILPYLVIRYFSGGIDFLEELRILVIIFLISVINIASGIALSSIRNRVFRIFLFLIVFYLLYQGFFEMMFRSAIGRRASGMPFELGDFLLFYLFFAVPILFLILEFSAGRISPFSENHDTPKRLMAILLCAIATLAVQFDHVDDDILALPIFILLLVSLNACINLPRNLPTVYKPFLRFGILGRLAGQTLLYPGWPTGIWFTAFSVLFCGLTIASEANIDSSRDIEHLAGFLLGWLGSLLFPLVLARLLKSNRLFAILLISVIVSGFVYALSAALDSAGLGEFYVLTGLLPACSLMAAFSGPSDYASFGMLIPTALSVIACIIYLFPHYLQWLRVFHFQEEQAMKARSAK